MSISAAGSAGFLGDDWLPARLGASALAAGVPALLISGGPAGVAFVVTDIDVFSDGSATGDVTASIALVPVPATFWNDTFGASTEGSRHFRGLVVVRPQEDLVLDTAINGFCIVNGFVGPYNAQVYGL